MGHDRGVACPGSEEPLVDEGDLVTVCFEAANAGDTRLAEITVEDAAFGLDPSDLVVVDGRLDVPLAPGEQILLAGEVEAGSSRSVQGGVEAFAVSPGGEDMLGCVHPNRGLLGGGRGIRAPVRLDHPAAVVLVAPAATIPAPESSDAGVRAPAARSRRGRGRHAAGRDQDLRRVSRWRWGGSDRGPRRTNLQRHRPQGERSCGRDDRARGHRYVPAPSSVPDAS